MKKKTAIHFDHHDYDYLDTLDKDGWHWEFTRRNINYQKAYDEMLRLQKESNPSCKDFANCVKCKIGSQGENAKICLWDHYQSGEEPPALFIHNILSSNSQNNGHVIEGKKIEKRDYSGTKLHSKEKGAAVFIRNPLIFLVSPVGIEPTTY